MNATCYLFTSENIQPKSFQRCFLPGKVSCQVPSRESIWGILGSPLIAAAQQAHQTSEQTTQMDKIPAEGNS